MIFGMLDYALSPDQLAELRQAHRRTRDKREADRIKAVVLLATGWTAEAVAEVLLVDPNTVRVHFKRYGKRGLECLRRVGTGVGGKRWFAQGQAPGGIGRPPSSEPIPLGQSGRLLGEGNLWGVLHGEWHDRSAAPVGFRTCANTNERNSVHGPELRSLLTASFEIIG